jgi:hypothetical protein
MEAIRMKIKVTVVQTEKRRYFDDEKQQMVEYEATDEIKGEFTCWGELERFAGIIIRCFPNAVIRIHIEREAE